MVANGIRLVEIADVSSETAVVGFWVDPPDDAGLAWGHAPEAQVVAWSFGVAFATGHGRYNVYGNPTQDAAPRVWAIRVPQE